RFRFSAAKIVIFYCCVFSAYFVQGPLSQLCLETSENMRASQLQRLSSSWPSEVLLRIECLEPTRFSLLLANFIVLMF
ncbi:hypothetical protein PMAYCL1PPCAC_08832, partial [Pristionchus mayeri]